MLKLVENKVNEDGLLSKIIYYMGKPPENSRVIEFTPAIAQHILENHNKGNRSRKHSAIKRYAADMEAGDWGVTGATIVFSDVGLLRNGQNRLSACVRSGTAFVSHVIFGVADELFHKMDQGVKRGAGDILTNAGYSNGTTLASAVRWVYILNSDNPFQRASLTGSRTLDLLKGDYPDLEGSIGAARKVYTQYHHPISQLSALHYILSKRNAEMSDSFFDTWARGVQGGKAKPIANLQDTLARMKTQSHGRVNDTVRAVLIIKAWNLWSSGRVGSKSAVSYTVGEAFPEVGA